METDLSGSGQVKRTTVMSAGLESSGRSPVRGRGHPIDSGAARLRSEDSLGDIRDSGGEARLGGLDIPGEPRFGGLDIPGERPGSED